MHVETGRGVYEGSGVFHGGNKKDKWMILSKIMIADSIDTMECGAVKNTLHFA